MIRVLIAVSAGQGVVETTTVDICNQGPVAPDEGWDSGGERIYSVEVNGEPVGTVRHFRRDGLMPLVVKSLERVVR